MKPDTTFDSIYREHHDFLQRTARRLCASSTEAEDLVQDSFLVAYRRLHKLSKQQAMRAWLFSIMFNIHRNDQRRRRRRKRKLEAYHASMCEAPRDNAEMRGVAERTLQDFLNSLNPEMRAIFILSEVEGMTGREVADSLNLNISTTYVRIRAARSLFESHAGTDATQKRRRGEKPASQPEARRTTIGDFPALPGPGLQGLQALVPAIVIGAIGLRLGGLRTTAKSTEKWQGRVWE